MKKVRNVLLGISVCLLGATAANATPSLVVDSSVFRYPTDTIAITPLMPSQLFMTTNVCEKPISKYKHVPLATDAEYFSDMSDYITDFTANYFMKNTWTINTVKARSKGVFPLMDYILELNELPKELKYLSVIESALANDAKSWVGAVGPWQFMSYTGREMGLTVNKYRDDRRDWIRSTEAAAKYMKRLYGQLDDWLLVIAAYNSGPTPVLRAINKTGSTNFWEIKHMLPRETQNHVLKFVATATIFEDADILENNISDIIAMK